MEFLLKKQKPSAGELENRRLIMIEIKIATDSLNKISVNLWQLQ